MKYSEATLRKCKDMLKERLKIASREEKDAEETKLLNYLSGLEKFSGETDDPTNVDPELIQMLDRIESTDRLSLPDQKNSVTQVIDVLKPGQKDVTQIAPNIFDASSEVLVTPIPFAPTATDIQKSEAEEPALKNKKNVSGEGSLLGKKIKGNKAIYEVLRFLGGGNYGSVWYAKVVEGEVFQEIAREKEEHHFSRIESVALKMMNSGLTDPEKAQFLSEMEVLHRIQQYESLNELRVAGYSLVPTVVEYMPEQFEGDLPAFMVQTLAVGQPLDELFHSGCLFTELDALNISAQFCRVLEALHIENKKAYLDFQPKDIFWDADNQRITVIDWNLLIKADAFRIDIDLRQAAGLIYRMLMGIPTPEPSSRRRLAQPTDRWNMISLGARELLAGAFHPAESQRFKSAKELRIALEELISWWRKPINELLMDVRSLLAGLPPQRLGMDQVDRVRVAACKLSIAEKLSVDNPFYQQNIQEEKNKVSVWINGKGYFENGRSQFDALGYPEALTNFELALNDAADIDSAITAARWIEVTKAAQEAVANYQTLDKDTLKDILDKFSKEKWEELIEEVRLLSHMPGAAPLMNLAAEAQAYLWLTLTQQAQVNGNFQGAAENLQKADQALAGCSYEKYVREIVGDLKKQVEILKEKAEKGKTSDERVRSVREAFARSYAEGYTRMRSTLDEDPTSVSILEECRQQSIRLLNSSNFANARALTALGLDFSPANQTFIDLHKESVLLTQLVKALDLEDFSQARTLTEKIRNSPVQVERLEFMRDRFENALKTANFITARFIQDLILSIEPERKLEFSKAVENRQEDLAVELRDRFRENPKGGTEWLKTFSAVNREDAYFQKLINRQILDFLSRTEYENALDLSEFSKFTCLSDLALSLYTLDTLLKKNQSPTQVENAVNEARAYEEMLNKSKEKLQ